MATYHGMTWIECLGCGHRTDDDETMEIWNDHVPECPSCRTRQPIRWGDVDGLVHDNLHRVQIVTVPRSDKVTDV